MPCSAVPGMADFSCWPVVRLSLPVPSLPKPPAPGTGKAGQSQSKQQSEHCGYSSSSLAEEANFAPAAMVQMSRCNRGSEPHSAAACCTAWCQAVRDLAWACA